MHHHRVDASIVCPVDPELDPAIVEHQAIAPAHRMSQPAIRRRDRVAIPGDVADDDAQRSAFDERHRSAAGKTAGADFRTAEVLQHADRPPHPALRGANALEGKPGALPGCRAKN